uniref:Conjugal transfer protein traF n=1 Tax=Staphylococcus aureus TaxID=1280 RepID=E4PYD8_STAAU|nr:Conjugal transfer protein traF [Staphylococcus aureus]
MKIRNFNEGTLVGKHNHLEYIINVDLCHISDIDEIRYDLTEPNELFFEVKDLQKEGDYFHIIYNTDDEYNSFLSAKKESKALKLSLMDYVLKVNPLKDNITVMHPANLFFKDIEDIKIGFRGHEYLPKPKINNLEQYKLLIMSTLSQYTFDKYYRNKFEVLSKEKDDFFHKVNNAETFEKLKDIVRKELNRVQTEYLLNEEKRNRETRKKYIRNLVLGFIGIAIVISLISFMIVNGKQQELDSKIAQADKQEQRSKVYENLYNGNVDQAVKGMKNDDSFNKEDIEKTLKKEKKYEELIELSSKNTPYVIEQLYKEGKKNKIRELAFNFENNDTLSLEKKILDKDGTAFSVGSTGNYEEQNKRLALASAEEGYVETAEDINKKLKDDEVEEEINKAKIKQLKEEKDNTKDKDKKKEIQKDIEELEKK